MYILGMPLVLIIACYLCCHQAMRMAKSRGLLPKDRYITITYTVPKHAWVSFFSSVWPVFFEKSLWIQINQICIVMSAVVALCVSNIRTL